MRPFRFGLLIERFASPGYVLDVARRAEAHGFSICLIRDHLIDGPFLPQYAPWTTLAAIAQATTSQRVGTLVTNNDFRHPAVLAKEVTTLDQLTGGRVELGLGAGFLREEYVQAGLRYDSNAVRVDRLEEALPLLDTLLRGEPATVDGEHYQFQGLVNFPPPVQRPRPPLLVGGAGPRMLSLAGRFADAVALLPASLHGGAMTDPPEARSLESVRRQVARVRAAAEARADAIELSLITTVIGAQHPRQAAAELARERGWAIAEDDVLTMPGVVIGDTVRMVDHLERVRSELGITYLIVRDSQLEAAIPIVEQLTR